MTARLFVRCATDGGDDNYGLRAYTVSGSSASLEAEVEQNTTVTGLSCSEDGIYIPYIRYAPDLELALGKRSGTSYSVVDTESLLAPEDFSVPIGPVCNHDASLIGVVVFGISLDPETFAYTTTIRLKVYSRSGDAIALTTSADLAVNLDGYFDGGVALHIDRHGDFIPVFLTEAYGSYGGVRSFLNSGGGTFAEVGSPTVLAGNPPAEFTVFSRDGSLGVYNYVSGSATLAALIASRSGGFTAAPVYRSVTVDSGTATAGAIAIDDGNQFIFVGRSTGEINSWPRTSGDSWSSTETANSGSNPVASLLSGYGSGSPYFFAHRYTSGGGTPDTVQIYSRSSGTLTSLTSVTLNFASEDFYSSGDSNKPYEMAFAPGDVSPTGGIAVAIPSIAAAFDGTAISSGSEVIGALASALEPIATFAGSQDLGGPLLVSVSGPSADFNGLIISAFGAMSVTLAAPDVMFESFGASQGFSVSESLTAISTHGLSDGLQISTALYQAVINSIVEGIRIAQAPMTQVATMCSVVQSMRMAEAVRLTFAALVYEGVTLATDCHADLTRVAAALEVVSASGLVGSHRAALAAVSTALLVSATPQPGAYEALAEALSLDASMIAALVAQTENIESLLMTADLLGTRTFTAFGSSDAQVSADPSVVGVFTVVQTERLGLTAVLVLGDAVYHAYAVNLESSAASRYDNYAFNSMARVGSLYLGASDDGLFLLDGADDEGEPIAASVKTGRMDFGSPDLKRLPALYVGMTADGTLVAKVTSSFESASTEVWCELRAVDHANARGKHAHGVKSRYWQFELVNKAGADFDIDSIAADIVPLTRRV